MAYMEEGLYPPSVNISTTSNVPDAGFHGLWGYSLSTNYGGQKIIISYNQATLRSCTDDGNTSPGRDKSRIQSEIDSCILKQYGNLSFSFQNSSLTVYYSSKIGIRIARLHIIKFV